jgi:hypothetical protein
MAKKVRQPSPSGFIETTTKVVEVVETKAPVDVETKVEKTAKAKPEPKPEPVVEEAPVEDAPVVFEAPVEEPAAEPAE